MDLKKYLRIVPDWPKKDINFVDITPVLRDPEAFGYSIGEMINNPYAAGGNVELVASTEARGYIFGSAVARDLGIGFVPIRKKGKLPWKTESLTYDLEYGTDTIEIHKDALEEPGQEVLLVDDVLATGGTMAASGGLIKKLGGEVKWAFFLVELTDLGGRERLKREGTETFAVVRYTNKELDELGKRQRELDKRLRPR